MITRRSTTAATLSIFSRAARAPALRRPGPAPGAATASVSVSPRADETGARAASTGLDVRWRALGRPLEAGTASRGRAYAIPERREELVAAGAGLRREELHLCGRYADALADIESATLRFDAISLSALGGIKTCSASSDATSSYTSTSCADGRMARVEQVARTASARLAPQVVRQKQAARLSPGPPSMRARSRSREIGDTMGRFSVTLPEPRRARAPREG